MKVLRLIAITSAALFAFTTAHAARPHSAKAQESELSAAVQAADIWEINRQPDLPKDRISKLPRPNRRC